MARGFVCVVIALMSGCSEDETTCQSLAGSPVDLRVAWRLEGDCNSHGIDKLQVNLDGPTTDSLLFDCRQSQDSAENFHDIGAGVYQIKVSALATDGNVLATKRKEVDFDDLCAPLELVIVMEFEAADFM